MWVLGTYYHKAFLLKKKKKKKKVIPALGRPRNEDGEFKANLGYKVRAYELYHQHLRFHFLPPDCCPASKYAEETQGCLHGDSR